MTSVCPWTVTQRPVNPSKSMRCGAVEGELGAAAAQAIAVQSRADAGLPDAGCVTRFFDRKTGSNPSSWRAAIQAGR